MQGCGPEGGIGVGQLGSGVRGEAGADQFGEFQRRDMGPLVQGRETNLFSFTLTVHLKHPLRL